MEELERLRGEVERLLKERSAISRLSLEMNQADSVSGLLQLTIALSLPLFSADAGLVYLLPMDGAGTWTIESVGISSTASANVERLLDLWFSRAGQNPSPTIVLTGQELPDDASLLRVDESTSSLLLASLSAADRIIGVIGFQRTVAAHGSYGVAEAELLESVAGQLATIYDNLRLRASDTSAFQDISQLSVAVVPIDETCNRVLAKFAQVFHCTGCWLATPHRPDGALQLRASRGFSWSGEVDLSTLSPERLAALPASRPGVWLFQRENTPAGLPFVDAMVGTLVVATLKAQNSCVGVVALMLPPESRFTGRQQRLLALLASQAGLVIHSAELLIAAQELVVQEERSRIAREIHDGVSQNLALLILKMEIIFRLTDRDPQRVKAELTKAQSIIEASIHELRRSIYTLRSPDLAGLGLIPALQRLAKDFTEQTNIDVELRLPATLSLPPQALSAVFSVVQERLDVVSSEGSASKVAVRLKQATDHLSVRITDNGQRPLLPPLDEGATPAWLIRLRDRVRPLGGAVAIISEPPEALVKVTIPIR